MKSDTFDKILEDLGGSINFTDLYCMGEPFLSKNIYRFIAVAKERGIFVNIDTNVNEVDIDKKVKVNIDKNKNDFLFQSFDTQHDKSLKKRN